MYITASYEKKYGLAGEIAAKEQIFINEAIKQEMAKYFVKPSYMDQVSDEMTREVYMKEMFLVDNSLLEILPESFQEQPVFCKFKFLRLCKGIMSKRGYSLDPVECVMISCMAMHATETVSMQDELLRAKAIELDVDKNSCYNDLLLWYAQTFTNLKSLYLQYDNLFDYPEYELLNEYGLITGVNVMLDLYPTKHMYARDMWKVVFLKTPPEIQAAGTRAK